MGQFHYNFFVGSISGICPNFLIGAFYPIQGTATIMIHNNNSIRLKYIFYTAAGAIGIAGILHLSDLAVDPDHLENMNIMIFFIVVGVAQIFWVIPTARRWGKPWYYIGIAGNVALIVLWAVTRLSPNPITDAGEAEPITGIGIAVQIAQAAYIGLVIAAIVIQKRMMRIDQKGADDAA